MKHKHLIGLIIAAAFVVLAILTFDESKTEYSDISAAQESGETVQIICEKMQDKPSVYDVESDVLNFWMRDSKGRTTEVIYQGPPPANFKTAPSLVVKGKFENDKFIANQILTKCPSKYEGKNPLEHAGN